MIQVKYKEWSSVSIDLYKKIAEAQAENVDEMTKEVIILSLLCECSEDDIWNLNINQVNELRSQLQFLSKLDFKKDVNYKSLKVGDVECDITTDLNKFSYGQYVDFQTYFPQDDNIANLLSTILIPKGKKYNDGYDIGEFTNSIKKNVDIVTANSICFFFLKKFVISMQHMNLYLLGQLTWKKILTKKKNPMYQKIQTAIESSKKLHSMLTSVLSKK